MYLMELLWGDITDEGDVEELLKSSHLSSDSRCDRRAGNMETPFHLWSWAKKKQLQQWAAVKCHYTASSEVFQLLTLKKGGKARGDLTLYVSVIQDLSLKVQGTKRACLMGWSKCSALCYSPLCLCCRSNEFWWVVVYLWEALSPHRQQTKDARQEAACPVWWWTIGELTQLT